MQRAKDNEAMMMSASDDPLQMSGGGTIPAWYPEDDEDLNMPDHHLDPPLNYNLSSSGGHFDTLHPQQYSQGYQGLNVQQGNLRGMAGLNVMGGHMGAGGLSMGGGGSSTGGGNSSYGGGFNYPEHLSTPIQMPGARLGRQMSTPLTPLSLKSQSMSGGGNNYIAARDQRLGSAPAALSHQLQQIPQLQLSSNGQRAFSGAPARLGPAAAAAVAAQIQQQEQLQQQLLQLQQQEQQQEQVFQQQQQDQLLHLQQQEQLLHLQQQEQQLLQLQQQHQQQLQQLTMDQLETQRRTLRTPPTPPPLPGRPAGGTLQVPGAIKFARPASPLLNVDPLRGSVSHNNPSRLGSVTATRPDAAMAGVSSTSNQASARAGHTVARQASSSNRPYDGSAGGNSTPKEYSSPGGLETIAEGAEADDEGVQESQLHEYQKLLDARQAAAAAGAAAALAAGMHGNDYNDEGGTLPDSTEKASQALQQQHQQFSLPNRRATLPYFAPGQTTRSVSTGVLRPPVGPGVQAIDMPPRRGSAPATAQQQAAATAAAAAAAAVAALSAAANSEGSPRLGDGRDAVSIPAAAAAAARAHMQHRTQQSKGVSRVPTDAAGSRLRGQSTAAAGSGRLLQHSGPPLADGQHDRQPVQRMRDTFPDEDQHQSSDDIDDVAMQHDGWVADQEEDADQDVTSLEAANTMQDATSHGHRLPPMPKYQLLKRSKESEMLANHPAVAASIAKNLHSNRPRSAPAAEAAHHHRHHAADMCGQHVPQCWSPVSCCSRPCSPFLDAHNHAHHYQPAWHHPGYHAWQGLYAPPLLPPAPWGLAAVNPPMPTHVIANGWTEGTDHMQHSPQATVPTAANASWSRKSMANLYNKPNGKWTKWGKAEGEYIIPTVLRSIVQSAEGQMMSHRLIASDLTGHQKCLRLMKWAFDVYKHIPTNVLQVKYLWSWEGQLLSLGCFPLTLYDTLAANITRI